MNIRLRYWLPLTQFLVGVVVWQLFTAHPASLNQRLPSYLTAYDAVNAPSTLVLYVFVRAQTVYIRYFGRECWMSQISGRSAFMAGVAFTWYWVGSRLDDLLCQRQLTGASRRIHGIFAAFLSGALLWWVYPQSLKYISFSYFSFFNACSLAWCIGLFIAAILFLRPAAGGRVAEPSR